MSSDDERITELEKAVIKINHFTERWDAAMPWIKDRIGLNTKLILLVLAGLLAIAWASFK